MVVVGPPINKRVNKGVGPPINKRVNKGGEARVSKTEQMISTQLPANEDYASKQKILLYPAQRNHS